MRKIELLVPASSLEVLKIAVIFGADAVYILSLIHISMEQRLQPCPDSSLKHRKRSEVTRCLL